MPLPAHRAQCRLGSVLRACARVARTSALALSLSTSIAFAGELNFQKIASGVYVAIAPNEAASPANRGFISNLGFIVGRTGVIVIGTGASERHATAILAAIKAVSHSPVVLAINLQATSDHVLGNRAFVRRGVPILAHRETGRFMAYNCAVCIRNARRAVGERHKGGSAQPTRLIDASQGIVVGGRELQLIHYGPTYQAGSLALLDRRSGTLFAGELVSLDRVPEVRNGDLANWRAALETIAGLPASQMVPAHGPVGAPRRAFEPARYLAELRSAVQTAYERGVAMQDAAQAVPLPAYANWALYEPLHRSNIHFTYLKVEAEDLAR